LIGVPLLDLLAVVAQRLASGHSPFAADRRHLHHKLLDIGFQHGQVVAVSLTLLTASNSESVVKRLRIFTTYWPYVVGVACVAYILPFAIWGVP
ncbi:MAG: undecaprenyl/decaprenyl-phosphate alpha-N-acetylglucosaminyl 1-phosphate transferase, partial [Halobacteriota archaeon]